MFLLKPITKQIIWGGNKLSKEYGIGNSDENIAEAWQLTCRSDGDNTICGGEYDGLCLSEYFEKNPNSIGKKNKLSRFPLLIKLIDAKDDLSIQVHPDDEYASLYTQDMGKTEMWYIVDCDEDAKLVMGLKEKYSRDELKKAIEDGKLEDYVKYVPVHKGDTFFIPSNTVHAICKGILIAEIQQNSNITYRLYDYNRRQKDGSLRQLHIEQGLDCIERYSENAIKSKMYDDVISDNPFFKVRVLETSENSEFKIDVNEESFVHIMCIDGECILKDKSGSLNVKKGNSVFCPAEINTINVTGKKYKLVVSSL